MEVRVATEQDKEDWDAYVLEHPEGVAYHQFGWGQAVKKAYGFEPVYLIAKEDQRLYGNFANDSSQSTPLGE